MRVVRTAPASVRSSAIPSTVALEQNYPNPFNPVTTIGFRIQGSRRVTLKVFDVLGQEVATLVDGFLDAGFRSAVFDGSKVPSGVYLYQLRAEGVAYRKRMVLIR